MASVAETWSRHLAAIEAEAITTRAYAEREGLSVASLYGWRKRLKRGEPVTNRPAAAPLGRFVPLQIEAAREEARCSVMIGTQMRLEFSALPSPAWLAALSRALRENP